MHTLVLVGELTGSSTATLEAAIEGLCERESAQIVLDLRRLERLDAIGAAVIAFRRGWCERHGVELTLIAGTPQVQGAFARAGLLERLSFIEPTGPSRPIEQRELVVGA